MPKELDREDNIDKAYDYSPGAQQLRDAEASTNDGYADAGIDQAEADPANASRDAVKSQETDTSDGSGGWTVNRSNGSGSQGNSRGSGIVKIAKKGGPAGFILGGLLSLAALVSFFGGPGLLIVQIAEIITNKFDSQMASADDRNTKILRAKLDVTTNGRCAGLINIRCKYSTFSKNDVAAFKGAGIEVLGDSKSVLGRTKATGLKFTDPSTGETRTITAKNFDNALRTDGAFRNATIKAYNTKFNTKRDIVALKSLAKSRTSYADPFNESDDTDEEREKRVLDTTKEGQSIDRRVRFEPTDNCDQECTDELNKKVDAINELADNAEKVAQDGIKSASPSGFKTAVSTLNTFGVVDDVCMAPTLINAIGTGAKVSRAQQLIRYSMFFLTTAGQIKAGKALPQNVSYLGTILTKTTNDSQGKRTASATDSISYRYAQFGDKGSTDSSALFKVGGGLGGDMTGISKTLYGIVGGKSTCDTLGNPWVQGAGVLVSFIPGFGQAAKVGTAAMKLAIRQAVGAIVKNVAADLALGVLISYLTSIAADMVAGVVIDKNTYGEQSGDALVTGGAEFLTQTSGMGGNLPLTPEQAIAYNGEQERVIAKYNSYDQATLSPFDTSSNATFLGSISSQLVPYVASMNTIGGTLSTLASIPFATFSNLTSNTTVKAESVEDYTECEDYEYREEMNIATTPMCNVIRGIPAKYLAIDPLVLTEELINSGEIDETTGEPKRDDYVDFVKKCLSGEALKPEDDCLLTGADADKKGRWAVHYIDQRNIEIMENGLPDPSSGNTASTAPSSTGVSGTDQELAKMILANKKITIQPKYQYQFENYAKGDFSCHLGSNLLKLIASLGNTYEILVFSVNRACTNSGTSATSLHSANGGGNAVDIARVNGVKSTGGQADDIKVYESAMAILPDKKLQLGQLDCRSPGAVKIPIGNTSREIEDSCDHVHIGIYQ